MLKWIYKHLHRQWYVFNGDYDDPSNTGFYGPFKKSELPVIMNDAFADLLAQCGPLEEFRMTDSEASKWYINSREFWLEQSGEFKDD